MKELTVIIISRSDEDVISDAILSARKLAEEVIVVDSNNDDKTRIIADRLKARVIKHPFKNFSDQRNFGILHATTPWILYLDSDERLTDEFCKEVEQVLSSRSVDSNVNGYFINRKTYYFGHDWKYQDKVQRIFYRKKFLEWRGVVHETPVIDGEFGTINAPIKHFTHRNLSQMIRKTNEWSEYEARLRFESGHPQMASWRFLRVMATEFIKSYVKNGGYKNGVYGIIEAMYQAFSIFITYAKLWELQSKQKA